MLSEDKYFQTLTEDELWQRYCGFLDLSIDGFMEIQKELLMEEIERVADSTLGKKIMGNRKPKSVEEFRRTVPLTTYDDYEPYLSERREEALAVKPRFWNHSSGRGGRFKWLPHSSEFFDKVIITNLGSYILASCGQERGKVNISPGFRFLSILPPAPYASGCLYQILPEYFSIRLIPPSEQSENMEFEDRIKLGFRIALEEGVDIIGTLGSILVKMGEAFTAQTGGMHFSMRMLQPKVILRLLRAWLYSKKKKRAILPKDIWPTKAIMTAGTDATIYRDRIVHYWGSDPYEVYGCSEAYQLAMQGWNRKGMVFFPNIVFLEFIPYEEQLEHEDDKNYQPSTVLLNEVEEGKSYEVVITQFYGMPLLRYRMKDIIKVIALRDDEARVYLPHIAFQRRADDVINLAGLAHLDEKTLWQTIINAGIKYTEWSACKEYDQNQTFLRLYLELREDREAADLETMIDEQLKIVDTDYKDIDAYLKVMPVRVTLLSSGTFQRYINEKRREGADLAHLKPPHVNPPDEVIQRLLKLSEVT